MQSVNQWEVIDMKQKSLARWLKGIILGMGSVVSLCMSGVVIFGRDIVQQYPEYEQSYHVWCIFLWLVFVPCLYMLRFSWKIAVNIGKDNSFCKQNAVLMKRISSLAAIDSAFLFIGSMGFWLAGFSHPSIVLATFVMVFMGVAVSVAAAALSHLILKAAEMKEENDLTI